MALNSQELQGQWNKLRGQVKEKWGQLTDDDLQMQGGNIDQLVGRIQQKTGEGREAIEGFLTDLTGRDSSAVAQAAEAAGNYTRQASGRLREHYGQTADQARETHERVQYTVGYTIEGQLERLREELLLTRVINPVHFAEGLGIEVREAEFVENDIVGMVFQERGATTVLVASGGSPYQKRRAIAHALGHAVLHLRDGDGTFVDRDTDLAWRTVTEPGALSEARLREVEANRFAEELLMPARAVRELWEQGRSVPDLKRVFQVPVTVLAERIDKLGLSRREVSEWATRDESASASARGYATRPFRGGFDG